MSTMDGARPRHGMLGGAILALLILLVFSVRSLLSGQAIGGFGLVAFLAIAALVRATAHVTMAADAGSGAVAVLARLTRIVVWAALLFSASVAFLASSILVALAVATTPNPGADVFLAFLKVLNVVVWLALGAWLLREYRLVRLAVILPPIVAWTWAYAMAAATGQVGFLGWGP